MDVSPLRQAMAAHVAAGAVPGAVTALVRGEDVAVDAIGEHTHAGSGPAVPMARDTIFRIASLTKPMIATAVLSLVQDGVLGLDDPVGDLLPELAARRVLTAPDGPLSATVPADREITVRDLLTFTWGFGDDPSIPRESPVRRAAEELRMSIGTLLPPVPHGPDEWLRRLATLPLLRQPGESWIYDVGSDVLAVLLARAAATDVATVLQERVFGPFGMVATGFHATPEQVRRLPPLYAGGDGEPAVVGRAGGTGTYWFSDLRRGTTALLLTQTMLSEKSGALLGEFETTASAVLQNG